MGRTKPRRHQKQAMFNGMQGNSGNMSSAAQNSNGFQPARNESFERNLGNLLRTPEQVAFEIEFSKWERGFEDWKRTYANHPDSEAYFQYERKFLDVRAKLMEKRLQIFAPQLSLAARLDNELSAASRIAESILQKFGEAPGPSFNYNNNNNQSVNHQYQGNYSGNNRGYNDNSDQQNFRTYNNQSRPQMSSQMQMQSNFNRSQSQQQQKSNEFKKPDLVGKRKKKFLKVLSDKMPRAMESATVIVDGVKLVCPRRMSGAQRKRFTSLHNKPADKLTEEEKAWRAEGIKNRADRSKFFVALKGIKTVVKSAEGGKTTDEKTSTVTKEATEMQGVSTDDSTEHVIESPTIKVESVTNVGDEKIEPETCAVSQETSPAASDAERLVICCQTSV